MEKYKEIEQGICPVCGSENLNYEGLEPEEEMIVYPWTCENCGATGSEWYELQFAGHNVDTKDGNQDILSVE